MSGLEERFTTHWLEGVGWCLFLLSSKASNLSVYLGQYLIQTGFGFGEIPPKLGSARAAGQTLTGVVERISHFQAGGSTVAILDACT